VRRLPLADGGEGTLDVLAATVPGTRWHQARVTGPGGAPVTARWLELPGGADVAAEAGTAVVELARASGLPLLARPDPMGAHTTGLGELLGRALDAGVGRILIGLGGSASTDGGTGALAALGARFLDTAGEPLMPGGGALADLAAVDLVHLRPPPPGGVTCLTDVTAPLLGVRGAAAVFGPQKGADRGQVARLETGLARLAEVLGGDPAAAGAGAAGGTGYGLAAAWGAALTPGAAELGWLAGLDRALADADLVITGEGRFDETSLTGKTCGTVIAAAAAAGVPVAVVAGQAGDALALLARGSDPPGTPRWPADDGMTLSAVVTLTSLAGGAAAALARPRRWLRRAGERLASDVGAESSPA
jgi:glycerate 2-kinase